MIIRMILKICSQFIQKIIPNYSKKPFINPKIWLFYFQTALKEP